MSDFPRGCTSPDGLTERDRDIERLMDTEACEGLAAQLAIGRAVTTWFNRAIDSSFPSDALLTEWGLTRADASMRPLIAEAEQNLREWLEEMWEGMKGRTEHWRAAETCLNSLVVAKMKEAAEMILDGEV